MEITSSHRGLHPQYEKVAHSSEKVIARISGADFIKRKLNVKMPQSE